MKYRDAGVDIDAGDEFVRRIKARVRSTFGPDVVTDLGSFGGVMRFVAPDSDTLLVASIDGVGTKLILASDLERLDGVGKDIVNHCVNDIAVLGARPLFFLDYIGAGRLDPEEGSRMVEGMVEACVEAGAALLGGETAEMPGLYKPGHYDLVGAIVGTVSKSRFVDGKSIVPGDRLIGLRSDGLHTNGYSLARRALFDDAGYRPDDKPDDLGESLADALLRPHRSYARALFGLMERGWLKGAAHITGGGIPGNLPRILPENVDALVSTNWPIPPIFRIIGRAGDVEESEMFRTFNMGIGMIAVVPGGAADEALRFLEALGETPFPIGSITEGSGQIRLG